MNLIKSWNCKENNSTIQFKLIHYCFLLFIIFLFQCAERDRTNIFDPLSGIDSLDINLYVTAADTVVKLNWSTPAIVQFNRFNLYRKAAYESNFKLIAELETDQLEYADTDVSFNTLYQYYLTIQGEDNESPPSHILKVTPGPLTFIILDRWGFALYWLSYDLHHKFKTKYTAWIPENLAFNPLKSLVFVTYPQIGYLEIFSNIDGSTSLTSYDFNNPFDCIYNTERKKFWFTDSSGYVYSIDPETDSYKIIDQNVVQPTQIIQFNQNVFVLESKKAQIISYNLSGERIGVIKQLSEYELVHPIYLTCANKSPDLYVIDKIDTNKRVLYKYSTLTENAEVFYQDKYMNIVKSDPKDNSVWVSINNAENSKLLQLSSNGVRLNEIIGFSGVSDFIINNETNTLIVVDHRAGIVKHIRRDSSIIGVYNDAVDPSKVYSE